MTIPFNTGIPSLLKEKGFDIITPTVYHNINGNGMLVSNTPYNQTQHRDINIPRPDYDQVLDWLEEKHGKVVFALPYSGKDENGTPVEYNWKFNILGLFIKSDVYPTRYEALNAGIIESLKLIK